ncbi:MAG: glycoside hydrolase family 2 [Candidatus Omnitrophica bacterium]|nr:glycoside hydrolase family 2 [Candidatus Omnitrophota bacterium]
MVFTSLFCSFLWPACSAEIPLPEHPRPDFEREAWINLNGPWAFQFDAKNEGLEKQWFENAAEFDQTIIVPFPWGSKLSQVGDEADIGWYARSIQIPESWKDQRIFLVVGACDWMTTAWLDGEKLGAYRGGYTPFEFELTSQVKFGSDQQLVLRVDDTEHSFKLNGKQGYGPARGIWQTPYLEARGRNAFSAIHLLPDIDRETVKAHIDLMDPASEASQIQLSVKAGEGWQSDVICSVNKGEQKFEFEMAVSHPHLWTLDDPFLYDVEAVLRNGDQVVDRVDTYFGMRKISVENLPGTNAPYIALNNKPIYLQLTLDQAYHPDGFYTFPSDEFVRDEILRSKRIGLNGMRVHVKTPLTRKLYWADRLGMLIMADVPNSWGQPDADMRQEIETALRGMIRRDFNHPSIFSWVTFNETWGLKSGEKNEYTKETQEWVSSIYRLAKSLDPTRLVEDNSPCLYDHVETDLNTWHAYLPGCEWKGFLDNAVRNTYPGSEWNFADGWKQGGQPMMNSECGNVWGYDGSTGDIDWSWDYHMMMNAFRRHPKCCGWLYTEHHDVINEWNGYYRFDRSEKYTGMADLAPGMSLNDLHAPYYIALSDELCQDVKPGAVVQVPVYASFLTDEMPSNRVQLHWTLYGWDRLGRKETYYNSSREIVCEPYMARELEPIEVRMPSKDALAVLRVSLEDGAGSVLHRNFTTFLVGDGPSPRRESIRTVGEKLQVVRFAPDSFQKAEWSQKQWNVLEGKKVNGAGAGYFEYRIAWPEDLKLEDVREVAFRVELSAKQLFGKDRQDAGKLEGDYMRGRGTHDPSRNPNAYPMTDETRYPGMARIQANGQTVGVFELPDDPADHRGILSWHSQRRDRKLREAGSYGYLVSASIPQDALKKAFEVKEIVLRLEADEALPRGLAIYGERFGRYPLDPSLIFVMNE